MERFHSRMGGTVEMTIRGKTEKGKQMNRTRVFKGLLKAMAGWVVLAAGHAEAADAVFREADGMSWAIHDIAVYNKHKAEFDGFASRLSPATKPLGQWFGAYSQNPYRVYIKNGGCSIGFTFEAPSRLTVNDSCIINKPTADEQKWARQVSWLFLGYAIWPAVSMGWPNSGWIDPVFKMMQADIVGQVDGAAAVPAVEAELDTEVKRSQYKFHRDFSNAHGWQAYQDMLTLMKAEKIDWNKIGANPSAIRSNYIYAYLSLAIQKKQASAAKAAGMADVSPAEVMGILNARNLLLIADRKGKATEAAWTAFRSGRYAEVKTLLPAG